MWLLKSPFDQNPMVILRATSILMDKRRIQKRYVALFYTQNAIITPHRILTNDQFEFVILKSAILKCEI
jgi:hypothetical protein